MTEITALIQEQIGQHIASPILLTSGLSDGKIQGKFKAANRVCNYVLTHKDLTYAPAGNMDSALFSTLYLRRFDAVAKRPQIGKSSCTYKSYQCGKICLGLRRRCRKNVNDVERVAKIFYMMEQEKKLGETRTSEALHAKAMASITEGDRSKVVARAQKMRNSESRGAKALELVDQRKGKVENKTTAQPLAKPSRLINKNSPILKPQNQISDAAKAKAVDAIQSYFKEFELSDYQSRLLAVELADQSIMDRIRRTATSAPNVHFSDRDKIESVVMNAKRIANALDESEELDKLLARLIEDDAKKTGNSL